MLYLKCINRKKIGSFIGISQPGKKKIDNGAIGKSPNVVPNVSFFFSLR